MKNYEKRTRIFEQKTCECGHYQFRHKQGTIRYCNGECELCMCPKYKYEYTLVTTFSPDGTYTEERRYE